LLSETVKLAETVQQELREAVNRGEGLIEAGGHDQRQGRIDETLGLKFNGKYPRMTGISIDGDGFTATGQMPLQLTGKTLSFTLDDAYDCGNQRVEDMYRCANGGDSDHWNEVRSRVQGINNCCPL
jgi:hypothetical protein